MELERTFSRIFNGSILDGLESALGESGMKAVLSNVELALCMDNPGELHRNLRDIFKEGAFVLEKVIVKELFRRLNVPYEETGNLDFEGYVSHARKLFVSRQETVPADHAVGESLKAQVIRPHLKVVRTLWRNSPVQVSFVVVDLNSGLEYPQNFVCVFPKNLFRRNQRSNLKRSKFFRVFGEKANEVARSLLENALERERDTNVRRQIEFSLRDIKEAE